MAIKSRRYYTLVLRDDGDQKWRPEFGDYDRSVVKFEMDAYTEYDYLKKNARIIESGDRQEDIDFAVAKLNGDFSERR